MIVDRNLLCDGQTIKQGRLCVNSNVGARCGRDRPGNKKRCGEISCVAPGASDNYALCQPAGLFLRVALPFSLDYFLTSIFDSTKQADVTKKDSDASHDRS